MRQTSKEYQNDYFKNLGYVFFNSVEECTKVLSKNRNMEMKRAIATIEDDTNCDCIILNDGKVAVYKQFIENSEV